MGKRIFLYGAGYYLNLTLNSPRLREIGCLKAISSILVTNTEGNPRTVEGIPVLAYSEVFLTPGDYVLLTLGNRYTDELYVLLKDTGACVVEMDYNLFHEEAYQEVKQSIQSFCDNFPKGLLELNQPVYGAERKAWTCWWQGIEEAPEIIKACWESQKRNLPDGVRHIIITKDNYQNYVQFPSYIVEKAKSGDISLAHMADILRVCLLYKYGGLWMDAAVLLLEPLAKDIFEYPIYTRNLSEVQYGTDAMWAIGFLYAQPGNKLFQFLSEGFFYYFSKNIKLKYYFTLDYMIAIACNMYPEIKKELMQVPYNNAGAFELIKHLKEPFNQNKYEIYTRAASFQFLTYKLNWIGIDEKKNTLYEHILKEYTSMANTAFETDNP